MQWLYESYLDHFKLSAGYLLGGHFSIKRNLLNRAELSFDTAITFGSSETDFFLTARQKGLILNLKKWPVSHVLLDSPLRLIQKVYLQGRGKKYIEKKGLFFRPTYRSTMAIKGPSESLIAFLYDLAFSWGYFSLDRQYADFLKE